MHIPVMMSEVVDSFSGFTDGWIVDGTLGMAGHSIKLLNEKPFINLLGIDVDEEAMLYAKQSLIGFESRVRLEHGNYKNMVEIAKRNNILKVKAILLDLGISSLQIDTPERGFSFRYQSDLDMRFDVGQNITAAEIINYYSETELANIFYNYGEERNSRKIANAIVLSRPILTTLELANLIVKCSKKFRSKVHPATKVFQSLRIAVNEELVNVKKGLIQAVKLLDKNGRIAILSYHSIEDRIIKNYFRESSLSCICPVSLIECNCDHVATIRIVNKKVIKPSLKEITINPRSRSAKLRIIEKLA
jgi:16S rRNA (cytosine1402-N4)-methyltransferase